MTKTGLFGFGYINESAFTARLSDLIGRNVTARDKQLIHRTVQRQLEEGTVESYSSDERGTISVTTVAPDSSHTVLARSVDTGLKDRQNRPILAYVCQQPGGKWSSVFAAARPDVLSAVSSYPIGYLRFRDFAQADDFIRALHEILLPGEQWSFPRSEENPALLRHCTRYQILESYLRHTFSKLMLEYNDPHSDNFGKIVFSQDKRFCYFNTGLLTRYAQDLYLTGEVTSMRENGIFTCASPRFIDSKITLVKTYHFLQKDIDPGPGAASFYRKVSDIVYDPTLTIDFTQQKLEHIIDDGIRRGRIPKKYTLSQSGQPVPSWSLAQMLNNSIKTACMLAQRDYKYVVPQYRPASVEYVGGKKIRYEGQIQFLMPIYLSADYISPPDFALVLSRHDGFYIPETILLLPWAYTNARILCKPDNSWLNPEAISEEDLLSAQEDQEEGYEEEEEEASAPFPQEEPSPATPSPEKSIGSKKSNSSASKGSKEDIPAVSPAPVETIALKRGEIYTFHPSERTSGRGVRGTIEGTDLPGLITRARLHEHKPGDLLGKSVKVVFEGKSRSGEEALLSLVEDAKPPEASEPSEETKRPVEKGSDFLTPGAVLSVHFTGTSSSKALLCEGENGLKGTISQKRLDGHKAVEFHGLNGQVRLLAPNSSGNTFQCEPAESVQSILSRKVPEEKKKTVRKRKESSGEKKEGSGEKQKLAPVKPFSFRSLAVGQRYQAVARDFMPYGVFVDIGYAGGNVLLHKSQIPQGTNLAPGDTFPVWIYALDEINEKVQVTLTAPK